MNVDCRFTRRLITHTTRQRMSGRVSDIRARGLPLLGAPDGEGRVHFLIHLPIEEQHEDRWCLWRPNHASFDERSIFEAALVVRIGLHSEERFKMRLERI